MTHFIKLENNQPVPGVIIEENLRQLVPELVNIRLFLPVVVESHGYGIFDFSPKPELQRYEKAVEGLPERNSAGIWMQTWQTVSMTAEEKSAADVAKAEEVRQFRRAMLVLSDWTQLPDSPLTDAKKLEWAQYRQQLRDVTLQPGFPWDVVRPQQPE